MWAHQNFGMQPNYPWSKRAFWCTYVLIKMWFIAGFWGVEWCIWPRSLAIITIMIGRHMEPGGGSDRTGDAWSLSRASQQKRAETAALPTVHTPLEIWSRGPRVARCQILSTWKVWDTSFIWCTLSFVALSSAEMLRNCGNTVRKRAPETHHCIYLAGGRHARESPVRADRTALLCS